MNPLGLPSPQEFDAALHDAHGEPTLKYTRLGGDVPGLLAKDAVSSAAVNPKFLILGTHWGQVCVMDFLGTVLKKRTLHRSSVCEVCIDDSEELIASAGDDGRVVISSLFNDEVSCYEFNRPIKCLQLDPQYSKTGRFAAGGHAGEVVLFEKSWRGPRKVVLAHVEGTILALSWRDNLLVYATDQGIGIYDLKGQREMAKIHVPFQGARPDLFYCHFSWKDDETLYFAWQHAIQVVQIKPPSRFDTAYQAQILVQTKSTSVIGGMQPFDNNLIVIALSEHDPLNDQQIHDQQIHAMPPECQIFDFLSTTPVVSHDPLSIHGHALLQPSDYRLVGLPDEHVYFLISPKDIINIKPREANDKIEWYLVHQRYEEALQISTRAAQEHIPIKAEYQVSQVGQKLLAELMEREDFQRAASLCKLVLGSDPELWESWIYAFAEQDGLDFILDFIPTDSPVLTHTVYEVVLAHYLSTDFTIFLRLIRSWPRHLYNTMSVISALEETLYDFPDDHDLLEAAIILYRAENMVVKELLCHLELQNLDSCLDLIDMHPHALGPLLRQRALDWFYFGFERSSGNLEKFLASRMLRQVVNHSSSISPSELIQSLEPEPRFQFAYLYAQFQADPHALPEFHSQLLELIAGLHPQSLMDFLKRSVHYPLDRALAICESRDLLPEQVFVLGRIGNNKKALEIMMERMDDIHMAIDYAKRQQDEELWGDIVECAVRRPKYWPPLFEHTGMYLDPIKLIKRVPRNTQIPGLKQLLSTIVQDFAAQVDLQSQSAQVLRHDVLAFMMQSLRTSKASVPIDFNAVCSQCGRSIRGTLPINTMLVFENQNLRHTPSCPPS